MVSEATTVIICTAAGLGFGPYLSPVRRRASSFRGWKSNDKMASRLLVWFGVLLATLWITFLGVMVYRAMTFLVLVVIANFFYD